VEVLRHKRECPNDRSKLTLAKLVPNRAVNNHLSSLTVRCTHAAAVTGAAEGCAWTGLLDALRAHLDAVCPLQDICCLHADCAAEFPRGRAQEHAGVCLFELVPCPVEGCGAHALRGAMDAHLQAASVLHCTLMTSQLEASEQRAALLSSQLQAADARAAASAAERLEADGTVTRLTREVAQLQQQLDARDSERTVKRARRSATAAAHAGASGAGALVAPAAGNAYIDACGEHDDDYDDLADFIVVKRSRDYSKVLQRGCHLEGATLRGHTGRLTAVCFSPDGLTLVSGGVDKTLRL
jgi:hypothetical protein